MASLLDLPAELILHILWFLDLADIFSCQLSHRFLHTITKESILLKYLSALKAAGMQDNRLCPVGSMSERLHMLNCREAAWTAHLIDFSRKIRVPEGLELAWSYGPNGGIYFFQDNTDLSLHYVSLPSTISDDICWSRIDISTPIIGIGLAIREHDLIAITTMTPSDSGSEVVVLLFEGSTGNRHPLAQNSTICTYRPSNMCVKITGDHLVLVTATRIRDYVDIFEWKSGILKMTIAAPGNSYEECLFLSPKVLLLPNKRANTLEFWDIPELPQAVITPMVWPDSILALPPVKHKIGSLACNSESEPFFGTYRAHSSSLPFYPSSADAIAILEFHVYRSDIMMFVHYRSLLNLHSLHSPPLPLPQMTGESSSRANIIPWDEWGPQVTRFLGTESVLLDPEFNGSANQRHVSLSGDRDIIVLDFNPMRIQNLQGMFPEYVDNDSERKDLPNLVSVITEESSLDYRDSCFKEPVISRLPYIRHIFPGKLNGVAIDDERLIGLRFGDDDNIIELEVLHIGQASSVMAS